MSRCFKILFCYHNNNSYIGCSRRNFQKLLVTFKKISYGVSLYPKTLSFPFVGHFVKIRGGGYKYHIQFRFGARIFNVTFYKHTKIKEFLKWR